MGATLTGDGVNFAVFSAHAEMIELCLFSPDGRKEMARLPIRDRDGDIWHIHVGGLTAGTVYGFRAHGPYDPERGHRFNPHKLLLDPYARAGGAAEMVGLRHGLQGRQSQGRPQL